MPQQAWNKKRERQYEHIKDSLKDKGRSESTAEEIAARTVNKTRAQQGESEQASPTSINDKSPLNEGGNAHIRAHKDERKPSSMKTLSVFISTADPTWIKTSSRTPSNRQSVRKMLKKIEHSCSEQLLVQHREVQMLS